MTGSLTRRLATFAATLADDDVPAEVLAFAKALTLDTLGTAFAATTLGDGCREVVAVMERLGGTPESTIVGTATRVAAPNAAFANGALAHALNYDAIGDDTGHTGVASVTAPLAIAEARGPVAGRRFLTAVAIAAEVTARLTLGAVAAGRHVSRRILAGQYFSYFGAAAGAGRLLGLTPAGMHSAFGLALMQCAGSRQVVIGGDPPAKAIYGAYPNHGGVLAALLAEAGLGAEIDALDGEAGFYALAADGNFAAEALTDGLGTRFACLQAQFKPWPTSGNVAPFIEGALELAARHDLRPAEIVAVEVIGPGKIRDWFEPLAERRRPANAASAANSTMFAVAKALAHRDVVLADFTAAGMTEEPVLALADRIGYRIDDAVRGGITIVHTAAGDRFEAAVTAPLGHPDRPLSRARLEAKFRDCCSYAPGLTAARIEEVIAFVERLETAGDVAPLTAASSSFPRS